MTLMALIWLLSAVYLIAHYLFFYLRLLLSGLQKPEQRYSGGVSVIICARNEEYNLKQNLPEILKQDYSEFEIIIADDHSTDRTAEVVHEFQKMHPHLRYIRYHEDHPYEGKKKALAYALSHVRYSVAVLTDADCAPTGDQWLSCLTRHFSEKDIVLGYGPLKREKGWLNTLQRWETFQTAVQYFSFAKAGIPYMGVGRNLAYSLKIFENSDRFTSHLHIPSGDDDLFVSSVADSRNTVLEWSPESFVYSPGARTFRRWWRQKRRHLSTAPHYPFLHKILLGCYGLAQLVFYIFLPLPLFFWHQKVFAVLILTKFILQYLLIWPLATRLKSKDVILFMPVWELVTILSQSLIHLQNQFAGNLKKWK